MKWQSNCAVCIKRENCNTKKELEKFYPVNIAIGCSDCIVEQPTNADRIRAMTDEELARYYAKRIVRCYGCEAATEDDCYECQIEWLKSPVEVDDGT